MIPAVAFGLAKEMVDTDCREESFSCLYSLCLLSRETEQDNADRVISPIHTSLFIISFFRKGKRLKKGQSVSVGQCRDLYPKKDVRVFGKSRTCFSKNMYVFF